MTKSVAVAGFGANGVRRSREALLRKALFASTALVGVRVPNARREAGLYRRIVRPAFAAVNLIAAAPTRLTLTAFVLSAIAIGTPAFAQETKGGVGGTSDGPDVKGSTPGGAGGAYGIAGGDGTGQQVSTGFDGSGGGGGGVGAAGGKGGAGGSNTTYPATNGGAAGVVGVNGGAGGAGVSATGNSTNGSYGNGGGGGGGGASALTASGNQTVSSDLIGGAGGAGGTSIDGGGGGGGAGGYGIYLTGSATVTVNSDVTVRGGAGGNGGNTGTSFSNGGQGGGGGVGVFGSGTLINAGTIATGAAGISGTGNGVTGAAAAGFAAVVGTNLSVVNSGVITGNTGADAITYLGGTNALTLSSGGRVGMLNGKIGITGSLAIDAGTAAGDSVTLANVIHDTTTAGSVTKVGAGTLVLSGVNTYSGGTYVNGGVLDLASASLITGGLYVRNGTVRFTSLTGAGTTTIHLIDPTVDLPTAGTNANPYSLDVAAPASNDPSVFNNSSGGTVTLSGAITTGTGNNADGAAIDPTQYVTFAGGGVTQLTNTANSWTGVTTINSGATLRGNTGTISGGSVANNGTLIFDQSGISGVFGKPISGSGSVTEVGSGTLQLNQTNTYTGATLLSSGSLILIGSSSSTVIAASSGVTIGTGTLNLAIGPQTIRSLSGTSGFVDLGAGNTLTLSNASGTFNGVITQDSGAGALRVSGGSETLGGANTYSGGTTIDGATTLTATRNTALGTGAVTDNGTLAFSGVSGTVSNAVSGSGSVTVANVGAANTLTFSNALTNSNGVVISDGSKVAIASTGSISASTGTTASAIYGSGTNFTVTNAGTIAAPGNQGAAFGSNGIYGTNGVVVNNTGKIYGIPASATPANYRSDGVFSFAGTGSNIVNNTGATYSGGALTGATAGGGIIIGGWDGVFLPGGGTVYNSGDIAGNLYNGIEAATDVTNYAGGRIVGVGTGLGASGIVINSGLITTGTYNSSGGTTASNTITGGAGTAVGLSGGTVINNAGGIIVGGTVGISASQAVTITNAGTIGTGTVDAAGTFTVGGAGFAVRATSASITNTGILNSTGASIYQTSTAGTLNLVNTGTIGGAARATDPDDTVVALGVSNILNSGTITTPNFYAVTMAKGGTLTNAATGLISAGTQDDNRYGVDVFGGSGIIDNYGTIRSTSATSRGILVTDNSAVTINLYSGSTTGAITTGSGADALTLYNGRGATAVATTTTYTDAVSGATGTITLQNAGTLAAAAVGAVNLGGGVNTVALRGTGDGVNNGAGGVFSLTGSANLGTLTKMDSGTWFINGTGTGGLTQISAGTGGAPGSGGYLLFAATGLTSAINVNGATVRATVAGGFGTGTITATDPTIQYAATGTYTNPIMLASTAPATDPTVIQTFGTGITATLTGLISQPGATAQPLIFSSIDNTGTQNTGTFVLTNGGNNYAGLTTISTGTTVLERDTGFALGSGGVSINSGGVLQLDATVADPTYGVYTVEPGTLSGAGTIRITGANTNLGFSFGNSGVVNIALASGALIDVQSGRLQGSASNQGIWTNNKADLNIAAGATFDGVEGTIFVDALTGAGTLLGGFGSVRNTTIGVDNGSGIFSGTIGNSGNAGSSLALIKQGTGTQTLSGTNTYTGATLISGGTLALSGTGSIANSTSVTDNANFSIVGLTNGGTTVNQLTGIGTVMLGANTLTANNAANGTISGAITGTTGGFTKAGAGNLTLSGANSYTGTTTIAAGTLTGTTASISGGSIVDNGTLAFVQGGMGGTFTPAITTTNGGTVSVSGTGAGNTLTFNGTIGDGTNRIGTFSVTDASNVTFNANTFFNNPVATSGGTLTNNAILTTYGTEGVLPNGGKVINGSAVKTGAQIIGGNSGINANSAQSLTVDNFGYIIGQQYEGVTKRGGGTLTLTNEASGAIYGQGTLEATAWGVGDNTGATKLDVTNAGIIVGRGYGIYGANAADTIVNSGTIASGTYTVPMSGNFSTGTVTVGGTYGVLLGAGGMVTNNAGGAIRGNTAAIYSNANLLTVNNSTATSTINGLIGVQSVGALTLTNYGSITGTSATLSGISASSATTTITNYNSIQGGAQGVLLNAGGTVFNNTGASTISATNTAAFNDGSGIYSNGALSLTNQGTISTANTGNSYGVQVLGKASVTNSGTISAANLAGLYFTGAASSIGNSGTITGGTSTTGGYGINAATGSAGTITNDSTGRIGGTAGGVLRAGAGAVSIDNSGVIRGTGATSYGINTTAGTGTITNNAGGIIAGRSTGILSTVAATITNSGTIGTGTVSTGATPAFTATGTGNSVQVTNGAITNSGTISGGARGIYFTATSGSSSVTNAATGVIRANNAGSYGVYSANTLTLTNDGQITAAMSAGSYSPGVYSNGANSAVTNNVSGSISGGRGVELDAGGTIDNYGQVTGTVDNALTLFGGGTVINHAGATLTAVGATGAWGIFAGQIVSNNGVSTSTLTNDGMINAGSGIVVFNSNATITNTGSITAQDAGIWGYGGPAFTATNSGTINAGVTGVRGAAGMTLTNTGSISGTTFGVDNAGGAATITNNGAISGTTAAIMSTGNFADTVNLGAASTTSGGISLGDGADTLNLTLGAIVNGVLDGGTGANAFVIDGTGNSTIAGAISNFGNLTKNGSGALTLSGINAGFNTVTINAGTLNVDGGAAIDDNAAVVLNDGTLGLLASETIGSLSGGGTVSLAANTLTLGGDNTNTSYLGTITGTGGLTKTGTGVFGIGGANTYTGATDVQVGTLQFLANDVLSDSTALTVRAGATLDLNGFSDTVGSFDLYGTLTGGGLLTANTSNLYGGTLGMALGGTTVNQVSGTTTLSAAVAGDVIRSANLVITGGTLQLGASDQIADTTDVTINGAGTLDLGAFSDTVNTLTSAGTLNGTGTLTAASYTLQGGAINANLGAGLLAQQSGVTTLNGTAGATGVQITGGTLTLGASDRLVDNANVTVASGATLNLGANSDTIGSFTSAGTLDGTGTLTAGDYTLQGGIINANLGAGVLSQTGGTTTLNGTTSATQVSITGGTLLLGAAERIDNGSYLSIASNGTLDLQGFDETVGSTAIDGTLNGTGTLTAGNYQLDGATVNANLGAGSLSVTPYNGRASVLNGTVGAGVVSIQGATLTLGASDRLADNAAVFVDANTFNGSTGQLDLGANNDTVGSLTVRGGSVLAGTGTLTAGSYTLQTATINANLGAGTLTQQSGTGTLNGTAAAGTVNVSGGTLLLGGNDRLANGAVTTVSTGATLALGGYTQTIGNLLDNSGTVSGGTLALAGGTLNNRAGTVSAAIDNVSGTGSVVNFNGATVGAETVSGGTLSLTNYGSAGAVTATGGNANLQLFAGSTTGPITLGAGNDTLTIYNGVTGAAATAFRPAGDYAAAQVGAIDLGGGTNVLTLRGTGTGANAGTLAAGVSGITTLTKTDSGNWSIASLTAATVNAGTGGAPNSGGDLTLTGTGNITDIYVNGASLTLGSTTAAGNATIHMIDPTTNFAVSGTYTNNFDLAVPAGQQAADPNIFNNATGNALVTLAGSLTESVPGQYVTFTGGRAFQLTNTANNWTGVTRINAGVELIGTTTTISGGSIVDNGLLTFRQTAAGTSARAISGSGIIVIDGGSAGTTLSGPITVAGGIQVGANTIATLTNVSGSNTDAVRFTGAGATLNVTNGGSIATANGNALYSNVANNTLVNAGTMSGNASYTGVYLAATTGTNMVTNSGTIRGYNAIFSNATLNVSNSGTLTGLTANSVYSAGANSTLTNNGTITGLSTGTTQTAAVYFGNGGTVTNNAGTISGQRGVQINGGGTVNNYAQITGVYDNAVTLGTAGGNVTNFAGATLTATATGGWGVLTQGAGTIDNRGTITADSGIVTSSTTTMILNSGTVTAAVNGVWGLGSSVNLTNTGTINAGGSGVLAEAAGTQITNSGTIAASTTAGRGVTMAGGTLTNQANGVITGGSAMGGTGAAILLSGTGNVLNLLAGSTVNGLIDASATTDSSNSYTFSGALNGGFTGGTGDDLVTLTSGATVSGVLDGAAGSDTLVLSGSGALNATQIVNFESGVKTGAGTWTLTGATPASPTSYAVNGGTLAVAGGNAIADTATVTIGTAGTFALNANETIGALTGAGNVALGANTLTTGGASASPTYAGVIAGSGGLTKVGTGTLTLSGANTYTGATTINGGTLAVAGGAAIADTSIVTIGTAGTFALNANETIGALTGAGNVALGANTLTTGGASASPTYAGVIAGSGGLTKVGTGTLTLSGANTYTGATTINGGTLAVAGGAAIADTSIVTIAGAGTLALNASETIGGLSGAGNVTLGANTLTTGAANASLTYAGVIAGSGGLTKVGTGTLTLSGANTYTGATTIAAGTLGLGASNVLSDTTTVAVANGAVLNLNAFSDTVGLLQLAGMLNGTGTLTASQYQLTGGTVNANLGAGTLFNLGGTSTLNGTAGAAVVNINGGTLLLGASDRLADNAMVAVANGATLDLGAFNDTVGLLASSGTLNGTGTLTAAQYQLNGATVNANLGAGTLFNLGGTSTLTGTAGAAVVNINAGTLLLGASNRLADNAMVSVATGAALNLASFSDTVGLLALSGTLNGSGTLTAGEYDLMAATVNANLGTGNLFQVSGASTLNGTAGATNVMVTGGTLSLGAANRLADNATVMVANGATLNLNAFSDTVGLFASSGTLNGTGTLTAAQYQLTGATVNANLGAGTLFNLSGTSTLNGTAGATMVAINGGTLRLGAAERLADTATVGIANGATFDLTNFSETIGTLTGGGTTALGSGTLTVGGTNADFGYGGTVSGSGDLTKVGTGTLTLVGNETMTGRLNANAGTLLFSGTSAGGARVQGGTLSGGGTFAGNLLLASGTLSPGTATQPIAGFQAGTVTVTGGTYAVNFAGSVGGFASDMVVATGAATLSGGLVLPTATEASSAYNVSQRYAILTGNSVSGTFGNGTTFTQVSNASDLYWRLRYDLSATAAVLEVRKVVDFTAGLPAGASGNQLAVGGALNGGILTGSDAWMTALNAIAATTGSARTATYDSIGGEAISDITTMVGLQGNRFTNLIRNRLAAGGGLNSGNVGAAVAMIDGVPVQGALRTAAPVAGNSSLAGGETRVRAWLQGFGASGTVDGRGGSATLSDFAAGVAGGLEVRSGSFTIGAAGAVSDLEGNVRSRLSRNQGTFYQGGAYAGFDNGTTFANVVGSYFGGDIYTHRSVFIGANQVGVASGKAASRGYAVGGALGTRVAVGGNIFVTPQVSGQVVDVTRDAFTETGVGVLSLSAAREKRTLYSGLGELRLSHRGITASGGTVEPYVSGGVRVNGGDLDTLSSLRFSGAPVGTGGFTIAGARLPRTAAEFATGIVAHPTDNVSIGVEAGGTYARTQKEGRFSVQVKIGF